MAAPKDYTSISRSGWCCISLVVVVVLILGVLAANHFFLSCSLPAFTINNLPVTTGNGNGNATQLLNSSSVGKIQVRNPSGMYGFDILGVEYALAKYEQQVNAKGFLPPFHLSKREAKVMDVASFVYDPNREKLPPTQVGGPESAMPRVPKGERGRDNGFVVGMKVRARVELVGLIRWRETFAVGCSLSVNYTARDSNVDSSACKNFLY